MYIIIIHFIDIIKKSYQKVLFDFMFSAIKPFN